MGDYDQAFQLSSKKPGGIESVAEQQKQANKLHIRRTQSRYKRFKQTG
jgi:hypothetical protein